MKELKSRIEHAENLLKTSYETRQVLAAENRRETELTVYFPDGGRVTRVDDECSREILAALDRYSARLTEQAQGAQKKLLMLEELLGGE